MDSQMRGDCNFTQLLEEGSIMKTEFMMDSPQDEVHTQQSPHEVQMESITRKTQWGGNFGLGEDCLIVSAWLNTSLDAVQGNEQKHKTYWNRVWEYFNKEKTFTSTRNANSPMNRWSTIQLQTNKFVGILASIEMANPSGVNEQNKIIEAKEAYLKVQVVPFKFDHYWNILRHQPKWLELVVKPQKPQTIRRSTATSSPSILESIHLGEDEVSHASFVDLERPPGRKAEKEQLNKRKSDDSLILNLEGILNDMAEKKSKKYDEKYDVHERAYSQTQELREIKKMKHQELVEIKKMEVEELIHVKREKLQLE